jgi:hypothetical protein
MERAPALTFTVEAVGGVKSSTLLGPAVPLKVEQSKSGVTITIPNLSEDLQRQPARTLNLRETIRRGPAPTVRSPTRACSPGLQSSGGPVAGNQTNKY